MNTLTNFGIQYLHGSHRGPNPPLYCRKCGRVMWGYERRGDWDAEWGIQTIERWVRCSAPWWHRLLGFHDKAKQDACGDWPWII